MLQVVEDVEDKVQSVVPRLQVARSVLVRSAQSM